MTPKLSKLHGVRLSEVDETRLVNAGISTGKELVDFIRDAALAEVARQESEYALRQVARLREAGIDLKALVDYALARQAAELAQAKLPGIFAEKAQGGRDE